MTDHGHSTHAALTLEAFERRCRAEPDLELDWQYWNWLLPDTAPRYFVLFILLPFLRAAEETR